MIFIFRQKRIIAVLAILLLAGFLFWILADGVFAAATPAPAASNAGKSAARPGILSNTSSILSSALVVFAALYTIEVLLGLTVTLLASLLDKIFIYNVGWTPLSMPVVVTGWTTMRDIVNALFILIVLWIAFTIIFNQEQWGGKKLLVRVIIIALTINFSLALVSSIFSITNSLAMPFAEKIKDGKVGSIIVANTKIQSVAKEISQKNLEQVVAEEEAAKKAAEEAARQTQPAGYYLGARDAKAVAPLVAGIGLCALGALTGIPAGWTGFACSLGATALSWITGFFATPGTTLISGALQYLVSMALGSLFLLVAAFALAVACMVLLSRIVAMAFLSVLAPVAFLSFMIPGKFGQKYWNMWLENLIKWAFYAPAFYFLLYLSLLMLQEMGKGLTTDTPYDIQRLFVLAVFFGFLMGAVKLSKWMGITVADGFVNWGSKLALGAVSGGVGLATGAALGAATRWGGAAAQKLESSQAYEKAAPYVPFSGVVRKGLQKAAAAERGAIKKTEGQLDEFTSRELQSRYSDRSTTGTDRAAIMKILSKRGDVAAEPGVTSWGEEQVRQGIGYIKNTGGDVMPILRAAPEQITNELLNRYRDIIPEQDISNKIAAAQKEGRTLDRLSAVREVIIEKAKPEDAAKWSMKSLTPENVRTMWRYMSPERINKLMRENTAVGDKLMDELKTHPDMDINPATYRFLGSNQARGLGVSLPAGQRPPVEMQQEEAEALLHEEEKEAKKVEEETEKATRRYEAAVEKKVENLQTMEDRLAILKQRVIELESAGRTQEAEKVKRDAEHLEKVEIALARKRLQ